MWNEAEKKFTWVIKNFSSLESKYILSEFFIAGGCRWCLMATTKGIRGTECLSVFLKVPQYMVLPCGWRIRTKFRFTLVNQLSKKLSQRQEEIHVWFEQTRPETGSVEIIPLTKLHDKDGGFLVNDQVKIVAEVHVLEVVGNLDVLEESSQDPTQPLKRIKLNDHGGDVSCHLHKENQSIHVYGFQLLTSQVDLARRVFERYPEIALECRSKNQDLRTSYMNVLLSLIKMLFKSPLDASTDDLSEAEDALACLKKFGFKLDWVEKKLDQVRENKKNCALVCEMEQQLHDIKHKCNDLETQLNKEKADILEATTLLDLYFSDVV